MRVKYYAGIGSRSTPLDILEVMTCLASKLENEGYILRTGGALGADIAFQNGVIDPVNRKIFTTKTVQDWCYKRALDFLPKNRPPFNQWNEYVQKLIARNMQIFYGENDEQMVDFVVCYTPLLDYSEAGGTGYVIRCARSHDVKVINLCLKKDMERVISYLGI